MGLNPKVLQKGSTFEMMEASHQTSTQPQKDLKLSTQSKVDKEPKVRVTTNSTQEDETLNEVKTVKMYGKTPH